jgi:hypothetical protein
MNVKIFSKIYDVTGKTGVSNRMEIISLIFPKRKFFGFLA